jgi:hypothetical protein
MRPAFGRGDDSRSVDITLNSFRFSALADHPPVPSALSPFEGGLFFTIKYYSQKKFNDNQNITYSISI